MIDVGHGRYDMREVALEFNAQGQALRLAPPLWIPAGEDDGLGSFRKNTSSRTAKTHTTSFSPLLFIISAEGGNDEQWSEAGIQLKYASGVAGHNRGEAALLLSRH